MLLHGFRGSPLGLKSVADELRDAGYPVYTPAIPPFGGAKPLAEYTPASYTNFLAQYLAEHHLVRPILIGHSMGSIIAAAAAHRRPELFSDHIVLMSPISNRPGKPIAMLAPLSASLPPHIVDDVTTQFLAVDFRPKVFGQTLRLTHACSYDHLPPKNETIAAAHFSSQYSVADFPLTQKVLLLAGAHDRLMPKTKTLALAQRFDAKVVFLPKTGHLHNYEKPHETAAAILDFLAS